MVQRSPIFMKICGFCLSRSDCFPHSTDRVGSCVLEGRLSNPCVYIVEPLVRSSLHPHSSIHSVSNRSLLTSTSSVLSSLHLFHVRCPASTQSRTTVSSSTLHLSLGRVENYTPIGTPNDIINCFRRAETENSVHARSSRYRHPVILLM